MPELPDVTVYVEALTARLVGQRLEHCGIVSPFLLRTAEPTISSVQGAVVIAVRRVGKRIAIGLDSDVWMVFHLMIAGRLHWFERGVRLAKRAVLARFEFTNGTLTLTEAGTKRRASLHLLQGETALRAHDPGGFEIQCLSADEFASQLRRANHTLKRALTDPHLFSGIGNAYSDEILHAAKLSPVTQSRSLTDAEIVRLHAAKLSPVTQSRSLTDAEIVRLHAAVQSQLHIWTDRLRKLAGNEFPEGVTAFREGMNVHGRFGLPCPVCGTAVQRIRYAANETNYCPRCQTQGRLLADRALSRLLKKDWPRTIDAFEKKL